MVVDWVRREALCRLVQPGTTFNSFSGVQVIYTYRVMYKYKIFVTLLHQFAGMPAVACRTACMLLAWTTRRFLLLSSFWLVGICIAMLHAASDGAWIESAYVRDN
jgi:hypothetical protein